MKLFKIFFTTLILAPFTAYNGYGQLPYGVHKELNFNVISEENDSISSSTPKLFSLEFQAVLTDIDGVDRIYLQMINKTTNETVYVKTINKEIIAGDSTNLDNNITNINLGDNEVSFKIGPLAQGDYSILLIIKDNNGEKYYGRKDITI